MKAVIFAIALLVSFIVATFVSAGQVCIDCKQATGNEADVRICWKLFTETRAVPKYFYTNYDFRLEPAKPAMPEVVTKTVYRGQHGYLEEVTVTIRCKTGGSIKRTFSVAERIYPTAASSTGYVWFVSVKFLSFGGSTNRQNRFEDADGNGYIDIRDMASKANLAPRAPSLKPKRKVAISTWGGIKTGR